MTPSNANGNAHQGLTKGTVRQDVRGALGIAVALTFATLAYAQNPATVVPEVEVSTVATLPAPSPHWLYLTDIFNLRQTEIIDGDTGKLRGSIRNAVDSNFRADPKGRYYFVSQSIWTRENRGTRQDLFTIFDASTLKIVNEVNLPGRFLVGWLLYATSISLDGRYAYIYNMAPSSSINIVDIGKRKLAKTIEIPGCGLVIPAPDGTTTSLCSDGSIATVRYDARLNPTISRSPVFFSAENDPIFDNSFVDMTTGRALFLSYSGLLYDVQLGATPKIGAPWSIQQAGGMEPATTKPLAVNWLPGGRQPIAFNRASGKAYVLAHMGEFWSQTAQASELWELDIENRRVLRRHKLADPAAWVTVSQGANPLIYLLPLDGDKLTIIDAGTFEKKHSMTNVGTGVLTVPGN